MSDEAAASSRSARLCEVTFGFLARRNRGEAVSVEDCCRSHPDLMPELVASLEAGVRRLRFVGEIQDADGPAADPPSPVRHRDRLPVVRGYRIVREIHGGGQGTVFEAVHDRTGRTVAVKVVDAVASRNHERFEREVASLARLDHPGIVGVLDRGRTGTGAHFLAMEYVPGSDLDVWVDVIRGRADARRTIVGVFADIAAALAVAHAAGIVHRDLKPSNVRVTPSGVPRIIDFGLAHHCHAAPDRRPVLTLTGNIVGSIPWASPEQATGAVRDIAPASDVYSLGVMLYHALLGVFPYPVDGPLHETTQHICRTPPRPAGKSGLVGPALWHVMSKCLAKRPADRFGSGGEFSTALRQFLDGQYRPPKARRRLRRWIVPAVACVAGAAGLVWRGRPVPPSPEPLVVSLPSLTNSIGMNLVQLPSGSFIMGSPDDEQGRGANEQNHHVTIDTPFDLAATEVTRGQFRRVMGYVPDGPQDDDCPVDRVSWTDAQAFCEKLSRTEGRPYRLPTEAEWEYACRAGTRSMYAGMGKLDQIAWYSANSGGRLHPVATLAPNTWGLYDMEGNAAEWVQDVMTRYFNDGDLAVEVQSDVEVRRVIRGGNVSNEAFRCRSAFRDGAQPTTFASRTGFRIALTVKPSTSRLPP